MANTKLEKLNLLDKFLFDEAMEDGAVRIFINTKGTNKEAFSREFLDFMEYIGKSTDERAEETGSEKIKQIHKKVCQIRKSEKVGIKYMQKWEELLYAREDGVKEGEKKGRQEGKIEGKAEGEKKVNKLGVILTEAGRVADFLKSLSDPDLQRSLFVEFGFEKEKLSQ